MYNGIGVCLLMSK